MSEIAIQDNILVDLIEDCNVEEINYFINSRVDEEFIKPKWKDVPSNKKEKAKDFIKNIAIKYVSNKILFHALTYEKIKAYRSYYKITDWTESDIEDIVQNRNLNTLDFLKKEKDILDKLDIYPYMLLMYLDDSWRDYDTFKGEKIVVEYLIQKITDFNKYKVEIVSTILNYHEIDNSIIAIILECYGRNNNEGFKDDVFFYLMKFRDKTKLKKEILYLKKFYNFEDIDIQYLSLHFNVDIKQVNKIIDCFLELKLNINQDTINIIYRLALYEKYPMKKLISSGYKYEPKFVTDMTYLERFKVDDIINLLKQHEDDKEYICYILNRIFTNSRDKSLKERLEIISSVKSKLNNIDDFIFDTIYNSNSKRGITKLYDLL